MSTPTRAPDHARRDTRTAIAVPNISTLQKIKSEQPTAEAPKQEAAVDMAQASDGLVAAAPADSEAQVEEKQAPSKPAPPKSWADLVRAKNAGAASGAQTNGVSSAMKTQALPKSASLAEALRQYTSASGRLQFLEPRGLVNTGNMCYMNSVSRGQTPFKIQS